MIEDSVLTAIKRFSLLESTGGVTVALSGGADSMALLHLLFSMRESLGISLYAAHLNHMIRGEEALRDERFVRTQCEKLGIPLFCERADVPLYAKEHKISTELAAREVRYAFLSGAGVGAVATAHTASDNFETVIFNLARGTGLKGLCGIPPKRGKFIRPLILCTRGEIEEYCARNGIEYVTDSTNLSDDYSRNRIRHTVVPVLKQINSAAEKAVSRTASSLLEDELFLEKCADGFLSANVKKDGLDITALPDGAVAKRAIKKYIEGSFPEIRLDSAHLLEVYSICAAGAGKTGLPCGKAAEIQTGMLYITKQKNFFVPNTEYNVKTEIRLNDFFTEGKKVNNLLLKNSLDCDKIMGKSVIRKRLPGDSIRLAGRGCTKTLKKLMNELDIPAELRNHLPVIADDGGVIWIYGIGVSQRCAVTEKTKRIMIISVSESKI